jgi:hypothetical protein
LSIGGEHWTVSTVVIDGVGNWPYPPFRIDLDSAGAPFMSYWVDGGGLWPDGEIDYTVGLARCSDGGCGESTQVTSAGLEALDNFEANMALSADGLPAFAVENVDLSDDANIAVGKCADPDCVHVDTHIVDHVYIPWFIPVIAIGSDDLPVLVYQELEAAGAEAGAVTEGIPVKMAICADPACAESEITALDFPNTLAGPFSLVLDPEGLWAVAYPEILGGEFRLARCANPACTEVTVSIFDDTAYPDLLHNDVELSFGPDGLPVVAFKSGRDFKIAVCHDPACSQATVTLFDSPSSGRVRSLMMGPDGYPIVFYEVDGSEWLAVCETPMCDQFRSLHLQGIPDGGLMGVIAGSDGLPLLAYQTESQPGRDTRNSEMIGNKRHLCVVGEPALSTEST